jgi:hypothetical protein
MSPLSVTEAPLLRDFIDAVSTAYVLDAGPPALATSTGWLNLALAVRMSASFLRMSGRSTPDHVV